VSASELKSVAAAAASWSTPLDVLPMAAYVCAVDGRLLRYNDRAADIWGRRPLLAHGAQAPDATENPRPPHDASAMARALRDDAACGGEAVCVVQPDGSVRTVLEYATALHDASGALVGGVGLLVDVTEREQALRAAEQAVRDSEASFRAFFESQAIGVVQVSGEGRFLTVNDRYCELTGYSRSELLEMGPFDLDHPDDRDADIEHVKGVLSDPSGVYRVEKRYVRKDGTIGWVHVCANMLRDEHARATRSAAIVLDISERKHAEEALQEADRAKDEFLATLAHELRSPLAPLKNAVELLRNPGAEPAWCREVIERQVAHLTRLIDDLLDVSRITRDKLELRRDAVEISELIRSAVDASRPTVQGYGQRLVVELPPESIYVDGDFVRLTQVLTNLLTNAAKFTEGAGTIRLSASSGEGEVSISVADTGIGLEEADLTRVFDKFYQSPRRGDRFLGGLGIGLALVRRLVELHGGSVQARSEGLGRGSELIVRLPKAPPPAVAGQRSPARAVRSSAENKRVLIVDDNVDSADSLARLLQSLGHHTATEYDGESAVERVQTFEPLVVLLDLGMPGVDGFEVCRRLRAGATASRPRIVAMTGWGREQDRARTLAAGFDAHLVKPVDLAALAVVLEHPDASRDSVSAAS
jgi:two-component system CheB/CheR fusion protein